MKTVGVLALQGAFEAHCKALIALDATPIYVKKSTDLEKCQGLIIPGGESTTMMKLIDEAKMREPLLSFARLNPVFGTCAGLILLSKSVHNAPFNPLGLLDAEVKRNAYGRQVASFSSMIDVKMGKDTKHVPALFIRAPQITRLLSSEVEVLAYHNKKPILIKQNNLFASTFHPELTNDLFCHSLFLQKII